MIRRTGEARLPCAGAGLPAIHTVTGPQDREQACSHKKPKLGLCMDRAEDEA